MQAGRERSRLSLAVDRQDLRGDHLARRHVHPQDFRPGVGTSGNDMCLPFVDEERFILLQHRVEVTEANNGLALDGEEDVFLDVLRFARRNADMTSASAAPCQLARASPIY